MLTSRRIPFTLLRAYWTSGNQTSLTYTSIIKLKKFTVPIQKLDFQLCRLISSSFVRCDESKGKSTDSTPNNADVNDPSKKLADIPKPLEENPYGKDFRPTHVGPFRRTMGVLSDDIQIYFGAKKNRVTRVLGSMKAGNDDGQEQAEKLPDARSRSTSKSDIWPSSCDVLVIGGGAIGSSVAYHLKERGMDGLSVVVVEQDSTYKEASTVLSVGGIRQQFSLPENILLSLYGMEFLRKSPQLLSVEGSDVPDMQFNPGGYLTLGSEAGAQILKDNFDIQREYGAKVEFLSAQRLKKRYPWINTEGIEAGVIGLENEGWFDPWSLLGCLRRKAVSLGAHYVNGKVTGIGTKILDDMVTEGIGNLAIKNIRTVEITLPDGEKKDINCAMLVLAAGAWSGEVGTLLGIGKGKGVMEVPIPIEPRKRYVYCVHAPNGPGLDCPLVIDPDHTYFRREGLGGMYLCGQSPSEDEEPSIENLEVDERFFENRVWPTIANRVPAFENLKLQGSWAGYYDYNTFDQNGIIGHHPMFSNMLIAAGFSGHGIQQAPGVGRAIMENILYGEYKEINLERFGFDRVLVKEPLLERYIV